MCCCTERSVPDEQTPSAVAECDAPAAAAVKCDDEDEDATTSSGANSLPNPAVDEIRCHSGTDTDHQPASHDVPVTSEIASTDAIPSHGTGADTNCDSVDCLLTDADMCVLPEPEAAGD